MWSGRSESYACKDLLLMQSSVNVYDRAMTSPRSDLAAMVANLTSRLIAAERPILDANGLSMWGYIVLSRLRRGEAPTRHVWPPTSATTRPV